MLILPRVSFTGKETKRNTASVQNPQQVKTVSSSRIKKAFHTARMKQILAFPRKMLPLPCISLCLAGT